MKVFDEEREVHPRKQGLKLSKILFPLPLPAKEREVHPRKQGLKQITVSFSLVVVYKKEKSIQENKD